MARNLTTDDIKKAAQLPSKTTENSTADKIFIVDKSDNLVKEFDPALLQNVVEWTAKVYRKSPTIVTKDDALYLLTAAVPYTSTDFNTELASGDWLGTSDTFAWLNFTPQSTAPAQVEGRVYYDDNKKALVLFDDVTGTSIELSYEIPIRCINNTGVTIENGSAVYINGASSGKPTIALADCCEYDKSRVIGVATHDIVNGSEGKVVFFGSINDIDTSLWSLGDILYLKKDEPGKLTTLFPEGGQFVVMIGVVTNVSATAGSIVLNISSSEYTDETVKITGWPDRANVTIAFDDSTRTFTISPTDGIKTRYYEQGIKYIVTTPQTIVTPDEYALYLIYFNGATLSYVKNPNDGQVDSIIRNNATVAYILWDDDNNKQIYFANELHNSIGYGEVNHSYNHFTRGAQYLSGLALTDFSLGAGTLDAHAQFGVEAGAITDEDLPTFNNAIVSTAGIPIYYLLDVGGTIKVKEWTQAGFSVIQQSPTARLSYNNPTTGQLIECTNNYYVFAHIFATNGEEEAGKLRVICGQAQYSSTATAYTGALTEINNIISGVLPTPEFVAVGSVMFKTSNYANSINARIEQVEDPLTGALVNYYDWRGKSFSTGGGTGGSQVEFSDTEFKIYNSADITKVGYPLATDIPTATTRTWSIEYLYQFLTNNRIYNSLKSFYATLSLSNLTANRTVTLQDKDITVAGLADVNIFRYQKTTGTPSSGQWSINTGVISIHTNMYGNSADVGNIIETLGIGSVITFKVEGDEAKYESYTLTSAPVLATSVYTFNATLDEQTNAIVDNDICGISFQPYISDLPLNNYSATDTPSESDDNTEGYSVGSVWIDIDNGNIFKCVDATTGAAVWIWINERYEVFSFAVSDFDTDLTTGEKDNFNWPYDFELESMFIGVATAPTGSTIIVDLLDDSDTTIFSTKPSIDVSEFTSLTAATPPVLASTLFLKGDKLRALIDQVGATIAGTGLKFYLIGNRI